MILVSDKDEEMRLLIQSQLKEVAATCGQARSADDIRREMRDRQASADPVQVWVTDSMIPDIRIETLIQEIRNLYPRTQILVLTTTQDPADLTRLIEAGASDFLPKPFDRSQLAAMVRTLIRRSGVVLQDSQILTMGELSLNPTTFDVHCGNERVRLTPSEFKLLHALMLRQGTVLSRDQLIEMVQGAGIAVIDRAVDTHVAALRKKLGASASFLETVRGVGYRITSP